MSVPTKNALDVSKIFLTYVAFGGDVDKVSVTLDVRIEDVRDFAQVKAGKGRDKEVGQSSKTVWEHLYLCNYYKNIRIPGQSLITTPVGLPALRAAFPS